MAKESTFKALMSFAPLLRFGTRIRAPLQSLSLFYFSASFNTSRFFSIAPRYVAPFLICFAVVD